MYDIFTCIYNKKSTIHVGKNTCPTDPMVEAKNLKQKKIPL